MMPRYLKTWLLPMTLMVTACATTPPARFYRLTPEAPPAAAVSSRAVIIGPFQLADYLDRPQIVTRNGNNSVVVADFERWAEPLDANFQGVVAANVSRLLGSDRVLEYPAQAIMKPERRVTGRVSQLDVDAAGLAVLEVQWGVLQGDGSPAQPARRSRYEATATGSSYAARVSALNSTVAKFSAEVAEAVRE
jgi:uncharacterized lipoprotein YmbA